MTWALLCVPAIALSGCEDPPPRAPETLERATDPLLVQQCPEGTTAWGGEPPRAHILECRRDDGTPHGVSRLWFPNGERKRLGQYEDGERSGTWTDFHRNGKKKSQGRYAAGVRDGVWTFWHKSGRLEERTWFRAGQIETWDHKSLDP